jgi:hypothetical protein
MGLVWPSGSPINQGLQSHSVTDVSAEVVRDVFGNADTRAVLLLLDHLDKPMQYSKVRVELGIHPEAFKRSLDRLEHHAMIGRIVSGKPNNLGRRPCYLEATAIGHFWAEGWKDFQTRISAQAKKRHIPKHILEGHPA